MATTATNSHLSPPAEKVCAVCETADGDLNLCTRCVGIYYCGKTCQSRDWALHKILCKTFAESPRPDPSASGGEHRRIIVFDPAKTRPEIVWVDSTKEWASDLLYQGLDINAIACTPTILRFSPIAPSNHSYDHHIEFINYQPAMHLDQAGGNNKSVIATTKAAGLQLEFPCPATTVVMSRWSGKDKWSEVLVSGGPKLQDMTMADFLCAVRWFSNRKSFFAYDEIKPTYENMDIMSMAWLRIGPTVWKRAVRDLDGDVEDMMLKLEESRTSIREARARGEGESEFRVPHRGLAYAFQFPQHFSRSTR